MFCCETGIQHKHIATAKVVPEFRYAVFGCFGEIGFPHSLSSKDGFFKRNECLSMITNRKLKYLQNLSERIVYYKQFFDKRPKFKPFYSDAYKVVVSGS